jgi:hypothetical protein
VRAGTLRVLTAMREALELALRLFSAAAAADPHHSRRLGDMSTAYGVVTSGPCWEVHCMSIDDTPQGVRFVSYRTTASN